MGLWYKAACVLLVLAIVVAAACLVRVGLRSAGGALFVRNARFAVRHVEVVSGNLITPELVREYLRIEDGMNLFALDVKRARMDFLQRCPGVRSMEISRVLPDTLRIVITERQPLARLAGRGRFVVDAEGVVFRVPVDTGRLPLVTGHSGQRFRAGDRVGSDIGRALLFLDVCEDPLCGIEVDSVRVDRPGYLIVYTGQRHTVRRIHLNWEGMQESSSISETNLRYRLKWVAKALNSEKSRDLAFLDATYEGRIYGQ